MLGHTSQIVINLLINKNLIYFHPICLNIFQLLHFYTLLLKKKINKTKFCLKQHLIFKILRTLYKIVCVGRQRRKGCIE